MKTSYNDALTTYQRLCRRAGALYRKDKPALLGIIQAMSTNSSFHESSLRLASLWELPEADRRDVILVLEYLAFDPPVPRDFKEVFNSIEI